MASARFRFYGPFSNADRVLNSLARSATGEGNDLSIE